MQSSISYSGLAFIMNFCLLICKVIYSMVQVFIYHENDKEISKRLHVSATLSLSRSLWECVLLTSPWSKIKNPTSLPWWTWLRLMIGLAWLLTHTPASLVLVISQSSYKPWQQWKDIMIDEMKNERYILERYRDDVFFLWKQTNKNKRTNKH